MTDSSPGLRAAGPGNSPGDDPADLRLSAARRLVPADETSEVLDALSELAARLLGTSAAHVCLLTDTESIAGRSVSTPAGRRPLHDSICRLAVDGEIVVPDARSDARTAAVSLVVEGGIGSFLGTPLRVDDDLVVGTFCVFDPAPRDWSTEELETLRLLAVAAATELRHAQLAVEYENSLLRWGLAIEAAEIGSFDLDLRTGVLVWDDRLIELFGYDTETFDRSLAGFDSRVHPDDRARVQDAIDRSIADGIDLQTEYRIVVPGRDTRWVRARGKPLYDADGRAARLLGAAYDTTAQRRNEGQVVRLLEAMPTALMSLDTDWRFTFVNAEAERLLDTSRNDLSGRTLWECFPGTVGSIFETSYRRAVATGEPQSFEGFYPEFGAWYEVRAWPTPDGLSLFFLDVTARHRTQELAGRQARRLELLAQVGAEITGTLDGEALIGRLAQLVVPLVADGCVVTTVDALGRAQSVGTWHTDPEQRAALQQYGQVRAFTAPLPSAISDSLTAGELVDAPIAAVLAALPAAPRAALEQMDVGHVLAVPMRGRGTSTGLLSLLYSPGRLPTDGDRQTAQDIADRAGLALDHALAFGRQQLLAEGLQRSLLTEPPEPDHMEIAVRYEPAAESARVGGDWYDAFLQPGGSTMLVIGDVAGHDTAAAAAMGQLRSLLRGIAVYSNAGPAEVLRGLDAAVEVLAVPALATVAVARFEQTAQELAEGLTRMVWANAGHLPPVLLEPDGVPQVLGGWSGDLLLGVDPTAVRTERTRTLVRGSTVVLYTDGLIERRDADLDADLARLVSVLTELGHLPLQELCDGLLERLLDGRPEDDVALVAVRLHRQDRPRPPEAGPTSVPAGVPPGPHDG